MLLLKILVLIGLSFGFRGNSEYSDLMIENFIFGIFKPGHTLAGKKYVGIVGMQTKTDKLSVHNTIVGDTANNLRVPEDSPMGKNLRYYLSLVHPSQKRAFCKVAESKERYKYFLEGHKYVRYSPNRHYGKNTIGKLFKQAAKMAGIETWQKFGAHSLRRYFISALANAENVSLAETMAAARHSSASASLAYQRRNAESEEAKFCALGFLVDNLEL